MDERSETISRPTPSRAVALFRRLTDPLWQSTGLVSALEVPGRRTGTSRYATVFPIEVEGNRYLVSQYGACDWVRNLRAAGRGTLHRKNETETITATEVDGAERDAVLAAYRAKLRGPEGRDFRALPSAADHPTFRVESTG
jgi:deazaflavin-dependent oxidoreductase (nitroreductase family)